MTGDGSPTEHACCRSPRKGRPGGVVAAACCSSTCAAWGRPASAQTTDDVQLWVSASTQGALGGPYRLGAELHARWRDDLQNYERTVLRLQAGLGPHVAADRVVRLRGELAAAGRIPEETRIWQQVIFVQPAGIWALSHRARVEERFVGGADRMVPRFRYSLRATRPLHTEWGAILAAEVFFQLRDAYREGQLYPTGFDRDRVQAGISRDSTHAVAIQLLYILQFVKAPAPEPARTPSPVAGRASFLRGSGSGSMSRFQVGFPVPGWVRVALCFHSDDP